MSKILQKILYVEDEDDIRTIVTMALKAKNVTIKECDRGEKALDMALSFQPDVILLDVIMPGIDGLETYRQLQTNDQTKTIPVIFMTAKVQPHELESFKNLGALGVIVKPFDPMKLFDTVNSLLNSQ